jgi:hypothetical protein
MILKPIKNYKQGKGFRHEITITKQDLEQLNNADEVAISEQKRIRRLNKPSKHIRRNS